MLHGIRYELRRFHDRGGMGEIWLGQDQRIGREVAIKILRPERTELQERFQFEAQVSGQLEHPGVVRVYDCDVDSEGRPFYVMQFIRGKTLKEAIATCYEANVPDLDFHRLIQTMVDLCQIIAYAHSRGVVHRDLKPVNVMLGAFGETLVLDWGLAKLNDHPDSKAHLHQIRSSGSGLTETQDGAVLGSPQYLSPEAALGRVEEVDQYSDIYLLGATLYEILTGRPPRHGTSAIETVELARKSEPPFPRTLRSSVPKPLDAICRKAMARNKNDRYGSASDMASDLQRFLAHEPVSVYSENLAERFERWMLRHWRKFGYGFAAIAIALLVVLAFSKWKEVEKLNEFAVAREQIEEFERLSSEAHYLITSSDLTTDESPYYQLTAGEEIGYRIANLVEGWGSQFANLYLSDDLSINQRARNSLRRDYYDLQMLLIQSRLNGPNGKELAENCLMQLKKLGEEIQPTREFRRLEELSYRKQGKESLAIDSKRLADMPDVPVTYLDHFLHGEFLRQQTSSLDWEDSEEQRRMIETHLQQAIEEFELAIDSKPDHYWAHLQIGRCLMGLGEYADSIRSFSAAIALRPDAPWAYTSRSLAFALAGDRSKALRELNKLIDDSDTSAKQPSLFLTRGFVHMLNGDEHLAIQDFDRVMQLGDRERLSGAAFYRAVIKNKKGDREGALSDLNWIIERDPSFGRAYLERANTSFAIARIDEAIADLNRYLAFTNNEPNTDAWKIFYRRGLLISHAIDSVAADSPIRKMLEEESLGQFRQAIDHGGASENLFRDTGRLLYLRGDIQGALETYEKGISRCPSSSVLSLSLGWLLVESDPLRAMILLKDAIKKGEKKSEAEAALGYVQAKENSPELAEESALEAILDSVHDFEVLFNVACVYGELAASDLSDRPRHIRDAIAVLRHSLDLWKKSGSPLDKDIPKLILQEEPGAFRALCELTEFKELYDQ